MSDDNTNDDWTKRYIPVSSWRFSMEPRLIRPGEPKFMPVDPDLHRKVMEVFEGQISEEIRRALFASFMPPGPLMAPTTEILSEATTHVSLEELMATLDSLRRDFGYDGGYVYYCHGTDEENEEAPLRALLGYDAEIYHSPYVPAGKVMRSKKDALRRLMATVQYQGQARYETNPEPPRHLAILKIGDTLQMDPATPIDLDTALASMERAYGLMKDVVVVLSALEYPTGATLPAITCSRPYAVHFHLDVPPGELLIMTSENRLRRTMFDEQWNPIGDQYPVFNAEVRDDGSLDVL